eukprot:SAG31_NODE_3006_length_4794_cov_3.365495_11_plen_142_part_00
MHSNGPDQLHGYADRLVGDHGPNQPGGIPVTKGQAVRVVCARHTMTVCDCWPMAGVPGGTAGPFRVSLEVSGHGQSSYEVHDEVVTQAAVDFLRQQRCVNYVLASVIEAEHNPLGVSGGAATSGRHYRLARKPRHSASPLD